MGNTLKAEEFIAKRPELSEQRKTVLRYLARHADSYAIEERTKGRSLIKAEFDCGAYKGREVLTFSISGLSPFYIATRLMGLTSGHHFSFPKAEQVLLNEMAEDATGKAGADMCIQYSRRPE